MGVDIVPHEKGEKKGLTWLKNIRSSQVQTEPTTVEPQSSVELSEEIEQTEPQNNTELFSKDTQDKIVLDLIVSLENLLKDRQLMLYKNKALEEQLHNANESINRLKQDQLKKEQLLQEKNKEIRSLEDILTSKQMSYEQLLEDYKEYQNTSKIEYDKIVSRLEAEKTKYNKLSEQATNAQYQSMTKINDLEEKIRNLEIEKQQLEQQYQKIIQEKTELLQTINDFTERMSFSFLTKNTASNSSAQE
jgi:DNA repair exonuclease SbcCD ATPase subunit